jgi:sugar/nucleoside kinase (ribokinase family)
MPPIISLGDLVADVIVSIPHLPAEAGRHQIAAEIRVEPGGGANFLIAGARLGQSMAAIGALGDDEWGHRVEAMITAEGVDLSHVIHNGTTTIVLVLVGQSGGHVFLGAYGHGSPIELSQSGLDLIKNAGAIFFAGYTLTETRLLDMTLQAIEVAHRHGVPIFFDPGPQLGDVPADIRARILPLLEVVFTTEEELPLLTPAGTIAAVLAAGVQTVVLKRGGQGCAAFTAAAPEPQVEVSGLPVTVVDTSAAGDSFNAGFMVGAMRGWSLADCAHLANAVGAAKVQKLGGGRSVPTLAEVDAILRRFDIPLPQSRSLS